MNIRRLLTLTTFLTVAIVALGGKKDKSPKGSDAVPEEVPEATEEVEGDTTTIDEGDLTTEGEKGGEGEVVNGIVGEGEGELELNTAQGAFSWENAEDNPMYNNGITTNFGTHSHCDKYLDGPGWYRINKSRIAFPRFCCMVSYWKMVFDFEEDGEDSKESLIGNRNRNRNLRNRRRNLRSNCADDDVACNAFKFVGGSDPISFMVDEILDEQGRINSNEGDSQGIILQHDSERFGQLDPRVANMKNVNRMKREYPAYADCHGLYGRDFLICHFTIEDYYNLDQATKACYCDARGNHACSMEHCDKNIDIDVYMADYNPYVLCNQSPSSDYTYDSLTDGRTFDPCTGYCLQTYHYREKKLNKKNNSGGFGGSP